MRTKRIIPIKKKTSEFLKLACRNLFFLLSQSVIFDQNNDLFTKNKNHTCSDYMLSSLVSAMINTNHSFHTRAQNNF